MSLLFDENLSPTLVLAPRDAFPGCAHVEQVGLLQSDAESVWKFAAADRPWRQVESLLRMRVDLVRDFPADDFESLLVLP